METQRRRHCPDIAVDTDRTTTTPNQAEDKHKYQSEPQVCPCGLQEITTTRGRLRRGHSKTLLTGLIRKFFNLLVVNIVFNHLDQLNYIITTKTSTLDENNIQPTRWQLGLPNIITAHAIECTLDGDCASRDKICHENKCICARDKPVEDQDRCLPLAYINEECTLPEQCMGNSQCLGGTCSCGNEAISLWNPSSKIFYCHPKRQLNQECNYDSQCPSNSYCSTNKYGCLCLNGFAPSTILNQYTGAETVECLPKKCSDSSSCEEYNECTDNICKCLATHFDPITAKCYKFGSTGGKVSDDLKDAPGNVTTSATADDNNFYSILKDLTENSDKLWLVLIILIVLSILVLVLIIMLIRKYSLGYCWTAHKKEYEPNNKNKPKNGYFSKNSINNKSFRQKKGELDEDNGDDLVEDRSNLVRPNNNKTGVSTGKKNDYVKININEKGTNKLHYQHQVVAPLKTSTSTPV